MTEAISPDVMERIPRKTVIATTKSGEVRIESGADGIFIVYDCDCLDALPYCHAHCCGHIGTVVAEDELDRLNELSEELKNRLLTHNHIADRFEMKRDCDGLCAALDRDTRVCTIYDDRPQTCKTFHCSRGLNRGFRLYSVSRQKELELMRMF